MSLSEREDDSIVEISGVDLLTERDNSVKDLQEVHHLLTFHSLSLIRKQKDWITNGKQPQQRSCLLTMELENLERKIKRKKNPLKPAKAFFKANALIDKSIEEFHKQYMKQISMISEDNQELQIRIDKLIELNGALQEEAAKSIQKTAKIKILQEERQYLTDTLDTTDQMLASLLINDGQEGSPIKKELSCNLQSVKSYIQRLEEVREAHLSEIQSLKISAQNIRKSNSEIGDSEIKKHIPKTAYETRFSADCHTRRGYRRTTARGSLLRWMMVFLLFICLAPGAVNTNNNNNETIDQNVCAFNGNNDCQEYPEYNQDEALRYLHYAKVAFCKNTSILSWSCGPMCDKTSHVPGKVRYIPEGPGYKVQGYVAQISEASANSNSTKCIVSFRGSLNPSNWLADSMFYLVQWPLQSSWLSFSNDDQNAEEEENWCEGCKTHHGFAAAYEELKVDVHSAIEDLGCTNLVVAGHSLGAAVGTIAILDLRRKNHQVDGTWAYGVPRVGNQRFVEVFEEEAALQGVSPPMWRVVHYHDPVPRFGLGVHGALEVYYTDRESSNYVVCAPEDGKAGENTSEACMLGVPKWSLINMDHVRYLNETFAFKDFPTECKDGTLHS